MKTGTYLDYMDDLNPSYREVYNKVVLYVGLLDGLSEARKDEKLNDLLDVMLSAQAAGKPVEKVCGRDVRAFCREYCAGYDIRFAVLEILQSGRSWVWLLLMECLLLTCGWVADETVRQNTSLFGLTVQDYFTNALLILVMMELVDVVTGVIQRYLMFGKKLYNATVMNGIRLAAIVGGVVLMILTWMGKIECIAVPVAFLLLPCVIWLGVSYWLEVVLKEDIPERSFKIFGRILKKEIPKEADSATAGAMVEKYQTVRDKKLARGIDYTVETFLNDEEQDARRMLRMKKFDLFLPLAISVVLLLAAWGTIAADPTTLFILVGVSFAVEFTVMFVIWWIIEDSALKRLAWIRMKREDI